MSELLDRDADVLRAPEGFAATVFLGRGQFDTAWDLGVENVYTVALQMAQRHSKVAIVYAIKGQRQAWLYNVHPEAPHRRDDGYHGKHG